MHPVFINVAVKGVSEAAKTIRNWWNKPSQAELARERAQQIAREEEERKRVDFERLQAEKAEHARRFCLDCKVELLPHAAFCGKCGSSRNSNRGVILAREREAEEIQRLERKKLEAQRQASEQQKRAKEQQARDRGEQEHQLSLRIDAARNRCRKIAEWKYCVKCRVEVENDDKFHITCGTKLGVIPLAAAFQLAHKEFPDIIRVKTDFNHQLGFLNRLK